MRVRLLTVPPLPDLKAWFSTNSLDHSATVTDLKNAVCCMQALKTADIQGSHVKLFLDDFELLNECNIDVVRDGDLICVKLSSIPIPIKSGAHEVSNPRREKSPRQTSFMAQESFVRRSDQSLKRKRSIESVSCVGSEHDSSEESSSTRTSSVQSSSSVSVSSSSSSSGSISAVGLSANEVPATVDDKLKPASILSASPIPPGCGKPATQKRNLRRRLRKWHEKCDQQESIPPSGISSINAEPLGCKRPADLNACPATASNLISEIRVSMSSLRNKNKKKGFKNSMAQVFPQKIVFSAENENPVTEFCASSIPNANDMDSALGVVRACNDTLPRLIVPSERQDRGDLPLNMFVTAVDVEERITLRKQKRNYQREVLARGEEDEYFDGDIAKVDNWSDTNQPLDITRAEEGWASFIEIAEISQLSPGIVVGWKGLAVSPATLTPEMLLSLARVVRCSGQNAVVRPFWGALLSFGGLSGRNEDIEEEEYTWADIREAKWRIVTL